MEHVTEASIKAFLDCFPTRNPEGRPGLTDTSSTTLERTD